MSYNNQNRKEMKRVFFAIATVVCAMVMVGCQSGKEDKVESHEVEVVVETSVTGAFTKAVSLQAYITDFDGTFMLGSINERFDGSKTSFEKSFKTTVKGNEVKTAKITFSSIPNVDINSYRNEPAPWSGTCRIRVVVDGNEDNRFGIEETEVETFGGMKLIDDILMENWAVAFANQVNMKFGEKFYKITVDAEGIDVVIE